MIHDEIWWGRVPGVPGVIDAYDPVSLRTGCPTTSQDLYSLMHVVSGLLSSVHLQCKVRLFKVLSNLPPYLLFLPWYPFLCFSSSLYVHSSSLYVRFSSLLPPVSSLGLSHLQLTSSREPLLPRPPILSRCDEDTASRMFCPFLGASTKHGLQWTVSVRGRREYILGKIYIL